MDRLDPLSVNQDSLSKAKGIYAWFSKETGHVVYVGKATGPGGLRHRIWGQRLNPNYLETRSELFNPKDAFHLENPVFRNGKVCIEGESEHRKLAMTL